MLLHRAMWRYAYELEKGGSKVVELCDVACSRKETDCQVPNLPLPIDWALKRSFTRKTRFNSAQKDYLQKKFEIGEKTGRKLDPVSVSQEMRIEKYSNGNRFFSSGEFLTGQQIQSFFFQNGFRTKCWYYDWRRRNRFPESLRRKKPYVDKLQDLVKSCTFSVIC